ncbi:MAG: hypothetical protein GY801_01465 [bacterium]|nr:hypothetical protein [bacterium]
MAQKRAAEVIDKQETKNQDNSWDVNHSMTVHLPEKEEQDMNRRTLYVSVVLAGLLIAGWMATGAQAQDDVDELKEAMKADQTGTNPINFTFDARVYNEFMWLNTAGDGSQNVTTVEFRAPFANGKWQFRGKIRGVSLKADFNDDGSDDVDESGFGDTDIRFMTVPYMGKKLAVALGAEGFFNTASEEALGTGATTLSPIVFLGVFNPIGPGSVLFPGYQHKFSVAEDDGRSKVHQGLIDLFLVKTFGGNKYWGYIDPQILLDYENDEQFMLIEIQGGMMVGGSKGHSLWMLPSFGVGGDRPYDFSLEVGYKIVWR